MEFLFDLLLTAFFSLLFAFLLSKLFSSSTSASASASASSDGAADVISGGVHSTKEDLAEQARAPRLHEGEDLQEEKIIEVDNVVEREAERGFLAEEGRSGLSESVAIGSGKMATIEGIEGRSDDFVSDVEFEKGKDDQGLVEKDDSFGTETSIDFEKEKGSFPSETAVDKVAQSSDLISVQEQGFVRQEESVWEVKLSESEVEKDDRDNLSEIQGSKSKMPGDIGVPTKEETCLKEEHEFKIGSQGSVLIEEEIPKDGVVSGEFEKGEDEKHNSCEVEGSISKTFREREAHLKELIVPEEISVEAIESSEQKKGEEQEQEKEDNLSKTEGSTSKMTQLVGVGERDEKGKGFNEEEEWEGIERTDIEKQFAVAAGYANSARGTDALSKLSNEAQLQLYGLHKVATEGPCYESHPLALRASTRAKLHAWQKLGNMNPDSAMEQYMNLLSKNVPDWFEHPIVNIEYKESDQLTIESDSRIEGPTAFGSESPEKGTGSHASTTQ